MRKGQDTGIVKNDKVGNINSKGEKPHAGRRNLLGFSFPKSKRDFILTDIKNLTDKAVPKKSLCIVFYPKNS